jgi:hypothetical protein
MNDLFRLYNKVSTNRNAKNYLLGTPNERCKSGLEDKVIIVNKYDVRMWNDCVWFTIKSMPGCYDHDIEL